MLVHAGVCTWKPEQLAGGGSFLLLCAIQVLHSVGLIDQQTALTLRHPNVPRDILLQVYMSQLMNPSHTLKYHSSSEHISSNLMILLIKL